MTQQTRPLSEIVAAMDEMFSPEDLQTQVKAAQRVVAATDFDAELADDLSWLTEAL